MHEMQFEVDLHNHHCLLHIDNKFYSNKLNLNTTTIDVVIHQLKKKAISTFL